VRYEHPKDDDQLIRDLEPLLEEAGADLVQFGHSHLWNRFQGPTGVNFLETSNVGNTFGAFVEGGPRQCVVPPAPGWTPEFYSAFGDPYGLEPITPTVNPVRDAEGRPQPFLSSNEITVFTILDTADGVLTSYAFDTREPESEVFVLDRFLIDD